MFEYAVSSAVLPSSRPLYSASPVANLFGVAGLPCRDRAMVFKDADVQSAFLGLLRVLRPRYIQHAPAGTKSVVNSFVAKAARDVFNHKLDDEQRLRLQANPDAASDVVRELDAAGGVIPAAPAPIQDAGSSPSGRASDPDRQGEGRDPESPSGSFDLTQELGKAIETDPREKGAPAGNGCPLPAAMSKPHSHGHENPGSTCHIAVALSAIYAVDLMRQALQVGAGVGHPAVRKELQDIEAISAQRAVPRSKMRLLQDTLVQHKLCEPGQQDANETFEALAAEIGFKLPLRWQYTGAPDDPGTILQDHDPQGFAAGSTFGKAAVSIHAAEGAKLQNAVSEACVEEVENLKVAEGDVVMHYDRGLRQLTLTTEECPETIPVMIDRFTRHAAGDMSMLCGPIAGVLEPVPCVFRTETGSEVHVELRTRAGTNYNRAAIGEG